MMDCDNGDHVYQDPHESLLYSARNGDTKAVKELLESHTNGKITLDISCKGKAKSNLGWTPLHLATYFGQFGVADLLLTHGADVNIPNDAGDTPLHKASFIGNEELVILLLRHGADVSVMNGEGKLPRDVSKTQDIHRLLSAAEHNAQRERELNLLNSAREGNIEIINTLLRSAQPPNINCVDAQGNSCLHCAAYRGHKQIAVILLQNGIDSTIRNINGQLAVDLARDGQMKQVLNVRPVRQMQRTATRFEGQLMKRSRFLGWKSLWAVLQRGVLSYYKNRADANTASNGTSRTDWKYLDSASVVPATTDNSLIILHFSDGTAHRLRVPQNAAPSIPVVRQEWITALKEHIAYSAYYLWGCDGNKDQNRLEEVDDDDDGNEDDGKPLGSMQDALTDATNHLALMESQLGECGALVSALEKSIQMGTTLHQSTFMRFQHAASTGQRLLNTLRHCAALVRQADESRGAKLRAEKERCRVLEEALSVLAAEHHELEQSFVEQLSEHQDVKKKRPSRFYDNSDDEFYDAFNQESDSDTIVSGGEDVLSMMDETPHASRENSPKKLISPYLNDSAKYSDLSSPPYSPEPDDPLNASLSLLSPASSCSTIMTCDGHIYRNARNDIEPFMLYKSRTSLPVPMFSRNDFSLWSVLKNCIGKELSKITMPVVFNEPLSFLQRMLEYLEYAKLLRLASEQEDPLMRMQYVAGFAVSALASNRERLGKPFNPLLGETYELQRPEFRALAEQVSHHPPVSAFHADSPHFIFHGSVHPKLRFWGKSVEIQPKGQVTVELPRWGEAYTWSNVNCCVHNIIVGRLWMEQYGNMEVTCHTRGGTAGLRAHLVFKPAGWASKDLHRVEGFITDKNKKKLKFLYGKWTDFIKCCDMPAYEDWCKESKRSEDGAGGSSNAEGSKESPAHTPRRVLAKLNSLKVGAFKSVSLQESDEPPIPEPADGDIPKSDSAYSLDIPNSLTLWEATPRPENTSEYYQFTAFAMSLNEMEPVHGSSGDKLCPTDSRLRPDIRCLERGDVDGAAKEKTRLEDKQRTARKQAKKSNVAGAPRWFSQGTNPHTKQEDWLYNGGYWNRNYEHLANIDIF